MQIVNVTVSVCEREEEREGLERVCVILRHSILSAIAGWRKTVLFGELWGRPLSSIGVFRRIWWWRFLAYLYIVRCSSCQVKACCAARSCPTQSCSEPRSASLGPRASRSLQRCPWRSGRSDTREICGESAPLDMHDHGLKIINKIYIHISWLSTKWSHDLVKVKGTRWMQVAQHQSVWRTLG